MVLGKDFLTLQGLSSVELSTLLDVALYLKRRWASGVREHALDGKQLAMVFEKPSLRTRVSFEVGMGQLGGRAIYISGDEVGLGKREAVEDVARVLSRYVDGIMIRTFSHATVESLARHATVPVINGLSDAVHPCQALADLMTIREHLGSTQGRTVVFIGDGNNVARSLARACSLAGARFVLACPKAYAFSANDVRDFGGDWGRSIVQVHDPLQAVAGADVLYTDVWTSMGQEAESEKRRKDFAGYQLSVDLLAKAGPECRIMHCLPAHRGEEISADAMESPRSIVFDQAENRLHAQKAILRLLLAPGRQQVIDAAHSAMAGSAK